MRCRRESLTSIVAGVERAGSWHYVHASTIVDDMGSADFNAIFVRQFRDGVSQSLGIIRANCGPIAAGEARPPHDQSSSPHFSSHRRVK